VETNKTIKSTRELAVAMGRSQPAVLKWLRHEDWTFGRGPWSPKQVQAIREWAATTLAPNPAAGSELRGSGDTPTNQLKRVKAAREMFFLKRDQKELHRVDECQARRVRQIHAIKNRLFGELDGLPLPPAQIDIVRNWLTRIAEDFNAGIG
jgi:hypothetical protein